MATKRTIELNNLSIDELQSEVKSLEEQLSKLKFDHAVRGLGNPLEIRGLRREVARLNTELRSREISAMSSADLAKRSRIVARRK